MTSAPGSNHDIMLPNSVLKRRVRPVGPHMLPATDPPPTLPVSFPVMRPNPLYPKMRLKMLLFCDPPT